MRRPGLRRFLPYLAAAVPGAPVLAAAAGGISDSRRRFDGLRAALEAALDAGPAPRTRKALLAAREIVLSPGTGVEHRTFALGKASRLLEKRSVARPDPTSSASRARRSPTPAPSTGPRGTAPTPRGRPSGCR